MKFFILIVFTLFTVYISETDAMVPKDCMVIAEECKKHGPQVKDWLIKCCCTDCGKPIPFVKAQKYIDEATSELSHKIIPYIKTKVRGFPNDISPEWIISLAGSLEKAFGHHKDLCKFDLKNPQHQKEIAKCKSIAIQKGMAKAVGLLPHASKCPQGKGIATHIMDSIPKGKAKPPPVNILDMMKEKCSKLCKEL